MPRTGKGRGGSRQGTPGTAYSNRTDLQQHKVAVMTAPSPQYGTAVAQQRAQQAMPIAAPPGPPAPVPSGPAPTPPPLTPLDAPSARPDEHVMAGASVGPGPGPEALGPLGPTPPNPLLQAVGLLNSLGDNVPDQVKQLRSVLTAQNANLNVP